MTTETLNDLDQTIAGLMRWRLIGTALRDGLPRFNAVLAEAGLGGLLAAPAEERPAEAEGRSAVR